MRDKNSVERLLWKCFLVMVFVTFFLFVVPYFMVIGLTYYYENVKNSETLSASERMQDDIDRINVQDIIQKKGNAAIVTGDLGVIELGNTPIFSKQGLSRAEWTDFLRNSGKLDVVGYDIAYNEKEDFWLVLQVPVAMTVRIEYAANTDSPENKQVFYWSLLIIGSYFLMITICAVIYAKLLSKRLTNPIKDLCQYTQSLEQGEYRICQVDSKISEIASLQMGLGHLSEKLKQHEEYRDDIENQRKALIMEISHDLKNPLASVQGYSELLLNQKQLSEEKSKNYIELIHANGVRANELLLSLFYYSQLESKDFTLQLKEENICEFMRLAVAEYIPVIEEKAFLIEVDIPEEEYFCQIDKKMLQRVFDNLLQNALKYNASRTKIMVSVSLNEKQIQIIISDNGRGIPKEIVEKVFLPFKRLDEGVRNSKDGGSGLGLAIVKKIITLHGGNIILQSDINRGCYFIITLPSSRS